MFLGSLDTSLLKKMWLENIMTRNIKSRLWRFFKTDEFLMLPHPLTNFEIQKHFQTESRLNDKGLNKYISDLGYFSKALIVLSPTSDDVSIVSFVTVIFALLGRASENFSFASSITIGITKKLFKTVRKKKKKHFYASNK